MPPFDCFLSSLPAEGLKLSLEKPTVVAGLRKGRRAPLGAPMMGLGGEVPGCPAPFCTIGLRSAEGGELPDSTDRECV